MIVVTAPTGNLGHQVVRNLLVAGAPMRLIVRDRSRLPPDVRSAAEVVEGSHGDARVVDAAFAGANAVFWLVPPNPKATSVAEAYVGFSRPAAAALARHRVKRVVTISALGRGSPLADKAGHVSASLAMDDLIGASGAALRSLANPSFMDNIARQAAAIRDQNKFFSAISGDLKLPSVASRDIAAVAARWLLDESWTGRSDVPVLGPADISFNDMAQIVSEVMGTPIQYQQIGFDAYHARFVQLGMSEAMAQGMTDMARAKEQGLDLTAARTAESSTPTAFRQWCEDTLAPIVRRSLDSATR